MACKQCAILFIYLFFNYLNKLSEWVILSGHFAGTHEMPASLMFAKMHPAILPLQKRNVFTYLDINQILIADFQTITPVRSKKSASVIFTLQKFPVRTPVPVAGIKTSLSTSGESYSVRPV